ncbi:MAG TPA: dihydroxyacetone kinase subunit DhaL [Clostridium sp.]|uniref:dihydroxyacetone kinase subunit DhaL n=1 Tax=Clostridium sp. TaxID=1506 RepID=UPI002F95FCC8
MRSIDINQTRAMIIYVADTIIENKPLLTEIDSKIGDGDHGIGMECGFEKVKSKLNEMESFQNINLIFKTVGRTMITSMGGASGIIFGTMFEGGAKTIDSKEVLDCQSLTELMRGSLTSVKKRGKAEVGDKTMIDAFEPAVIAMENVKNDDLVTLLTNAEEAAKKGMEDTKKYVAKFGRAKSLLERSIGFQDAGATSVWIIFRAMKEYVSKL